MGSCVRTLVRSGAKIANPSYSSYTLRFGSIEHDSCMSCDLALASRSSCLWTVSDI